MCVRTRVLLFCLDIDCRCLSCAPLTISRPKPESRRVGEATNRILSSSWAKCCRWMAGRRLSGSTEAFVSPQGRENCLYHVPLPAPSGHVVSPYICAGVERAAVPRRAHVISSTQCSVAYTANWLGQTTGTLYGRLRWHGAILWKRAVLEECRSQPWPTPLSQNAGETRLRPGFPRW